MILESCIKVRGLARLFMLCAAVCVLIPGAATHAQPPEPKEHARVAPKPERPEDLLRMRLERIIMDSERAQREARESLKKLDEGMHAEEVVRSSRLRGLHPLRGRLNPAQGDGPRAGQGRGPAEFPPRAERPSGPGPRDDRSGSQARDRIFKPPMRPLSDEERKLLRETMRELTPRLHDTIDEVHARDERLAGTMLDRMAPMIRTLKEQRERDPAFFELRVGEMRSTLDVMRRVHEYRLAARSGKPPAELEGLREAAREAIARNFDDRIAIQRHQAEELAQRVESLRDEIDRTLSEREQAIERVIARMLGDDRMNDRESR